MKNIRFKILIITCIVCLLPIFIGLGFYNQLPDRVAVHFDVNNNPDGFFPKPLFVFGIPILMMAIQIFCCILSDLSDTRPVEDRKAAKIYKWIIPILTVVMYIVTMMHGLGKDVDVRSIAMIIIGLILIVIGYNFSKTAGIHFYWFKNLKNDENIKKRIVRIFRWILVLDGILFLLSAILSVGFSIFCIILLIVETVLLYVYCYKKNIAKL